MEMTEVKCPKFGITKVIKHGKTETGYQRYYCKNEDCRMGSFQLEQSYKGCSHEIETQIIETTANASGIRDISRVLKVSTYKVMYTLKKQNLQ